MRLIPTFRRWLDSRGTVGAYGGLEKTFVMWG